MLLRQGNLFANVVKWPLVSAKIVDRWGPLVVGGQSRGVLLLVRLKGIQEMLPPNVVSPLPPDLGLTNSPYHPCPSS